MSELYTTVRGQQRERIVVPSVSNPVVTLENELDIDLRIKLSRDESGDLVVRLLKTANAASEKCREYGTEECAYDGYGDHMCGPKDPSDPDNSQSDVQEKK